MVENWLISSEEKIIWKINGTKWERELKPEAQENTDKEKLPYKYEVLFVRGL